MTADPLFFELRPRKIILRELLLQQQKEERERREKRVLDRSNDQYIMDENDVKEMGLDINDLMHADFDIFDFDNIEKNAPKSNASINSIIDEMEDVDIDDDDLDDEEDDDEDEDLSIKKKSKKKKKKKDKSKKKKEKKVIDFEKVKEIKEQDREKMLAEKAKRKEEKARIKFEEEKKQAEVDIIGLVARKDYLKLSLNKLDKGRKKDAIKIVNINIEIREIEVAIESLRSKYNIPVPEIDNGSRFSRFCNTIKSGVKRAYRKVSKFFKRNKELIIGISSIVIPAIASSVASIIVAK